MKRWALFCGVTLLFAGIASAQENPKVEVFAGYSHLYVNVQTTGGYYNWTPSANGGSASASFNPNNWLGLVADFGGYTSGGAPPPSSTSFSGLNADVYTYLFGPKVALRTSKFTPFAQALLGGAHITNSMNLGGGAALKPIPGSQESFATALGGGLDWNATSHIGVRVAQVEWLMTRFKDNSNGRQDNVRISAGVVFRF